MVWSKSLIIRIEGVLWSGNAALTQSENHASAYRENPDCRTERATHDSVDVSPIGSLRIIPRRCQSLGRHEAVARATHGLDEWIKTGDVELLSQVTDVHVDHVVARVKSVLPHFVQDSSP